MINRKRPWYITECPEGEQFVSAENENENQFISETFVKPSQQSIWMQAIVCAGGKLCDQDYGPVFYSNIDGELPNTGCVQLPFGGGMKWLVKNCRDTAAYVCKYGQYL
jgi:hypothetical protein